MHTLGFIVVLLSVLAAVTTAFYVPNEDYYYPSMVDKRNLPLRSRPNKRDFSPDDLTLRFGKRSALDKREFSADDLTLRFGKRSLSSFNPEDLALRFGRK